MSFDTPILFLVFNRPDTTARVFQRIKELQPTKLFIAADGPREAKEGEKCEAVRGLIIDGIDWPCQVETLFRFHNLGCGNAVSSAISWFFENVEEGIILEDDTLPDPSFFTFCKILLEKYRDNAKIKMISGNNFQYGKWRGDGSYYFSAYSHIWGWATWRRVWNEYDFVLQSMTKETLEIYMQNYFKERAVVQFWKTILQKLKDGLINTWDCQLLFSIWKHHGFSILPNMNLVSNIGFGESSTHTKNEKDITSNIPVSPIIQIDHPRKIEIDKTADLYYFRKYLQEHRNLFERIKYKVLRIN